MPLQPGTRLGPYEILAPLGAGGMGAVWKARDTRLDRIVAIKTIHGAFSERFEREARAISALNHPHICALYDVGEESLAGPEASLVPSAINDSHQPSALRHDDGTEKVRFLVMEYVEGATLKGPLPLDQALKYAAQICDALDAAHRKGIVHRDLKPDNILLTKGGVKLLDFGLAKLTAPPAAVGSTGSASNVRREAEIAATKALTGAHVILGTPQYMAPEQIEGRDADARTDLFAFGGVLYELLTGQKAFDGKTPSSTMAAILASEPRPMRDLQPVTPASVERIVTRCLAKDPDDRWQSARDLKAEIEWIAAGGAATEAGERVPQTGTRLPWAVAAALAVVAAASAIVAWSHWNAPGPSAPAVAFDLAPPPGHVIRGAPVLSTDGRQIAALAVDAHGKPSLWTRRLESFEWRPLSDSSIVPNLGAWSHDGRYLIWTGGGKLRKVDMIAGGPSQVLCDVDGSSIPFTAVNAEGTILFANHQILWRIPLAGGVPTQVTSLDPSRQESRHTVIQFLADGKRFLYRAESADAGKSATFVASLDSGMDSRKRTVVSTGLTSAKVGRGPGGEDYLLFEASGALMAQPFDVGALRVTGDAFLVAPAITLSRGGFLPVSISDTGVLVLSVESSISPRSQFAWVDRRGANRVDVGVAGQYGEFALSQDDTRLAVVEYAGGNGDLWLLDLAGGSAPTRFTSRPADDRFPLWSPDGQHVVFRSSVDGGLAMLQKDANGAIGSEQPVLRSQDGPRPYSWSRDGQILFGTPGDLSVRAPDGTVTPFRRTEFVEAQGQFSPDGRWVAFMSDEGKRNDVYVLSFPVAGAARPISSAGGTQPRWSPDGKELFYIAPDSKLMAVQVKTGSGFDHGVPVPLFDTGLRNLGTTSSFAYAVSRDGQRFLLQVPVQESVTVPPVKILTNWLVTAKK